MTARTFLKPSLMEWGGNKITDHNRDALDVSVERIEEAIRMANGTMRKYIVADKRTFSCSWKDVPHNAMYTVDGFWGKREMENWYNTQPGAFVLNIHHGDDTVEPITVMMSKFSATLSKRGRFDFWDVSVELEEV